MFNYKIIPVFLITLLLTGCYDDGADKQQNLLNAGVVVISPQNIPLTFEFAARAQGSKETEVRARVGGILLKRNYIEGSEVKEGSVLFEIDPEPYQVALNQAKAKLEQSKAELKNAKTQLNRTEKLYKQKYASEKSYDDAVATYDSLQAALLLAQAEVDAAQLNLDYTKVKAPISGLTSMEAQSEGSLISTSGDGGLLTHIIQLDPIYVMFSLSENEMMTMARMISSGQIKNPQDKDAVKAILHFDADHTYDYPGKINFVNPSIDSSTGTIKLRAVFPNPEKRLRPGQFMRLTVEGLVRSNAHVLPQEAVMQGANGSYVYRLKDDNTVETVPVVTGLSTKNSEWIIDDGLEAGDRIVVNNLLKIRPGMKINPEILSSEALPEMTQTAMEKK